MKLAITGLLLLSAIAQCPAQDLGKIEAINFSQYQDLIKPDSNNLSIINFWASWCGPCVKELPYFQSIDKQLGVKVKLISVDFIQDQAKAQAMLNKKNIALPAYLLNEKNFVEKIDDNWSGSLPATLIIKPDGQRLFYEKSFSEEELTALVNNINSK